MTTFYEKNNMEEKIIRTAKKVFIEKGYIETSMSEIAARVGINRSGLHYYFRTKEKMFQAVFGDIVSSIIPKVLEIMVQKEKPISNRIEEIVDAYYLLFTENPHLPMFVIREMNRDASLLIETVKQMDFQAILGNMQSSLQEEMDEGKLKRIPFRFLFYNLYGLMVMPFLTQDITNSILLEENETFTEMLDKWKPYIISQLEKLLSNSID